MPLVRGRDATGPYYRWGAAADGHTKFHYRAGVAPSRRRAKTRARAQGGITGGGRARPPLDSAQRAAAKLRAGGVRLKKLAGRRAVFPRSKRPPPSGQRKGAGRRRGGRPRA